MKVGARRAARCAHGADALTLADALPKLHIDAGQMKESAAETMTMVDHQQIALKREWPISGQNHDAVGRSKDWISGRPRDIDAAMIGARHASVNALRSEQSGNTADPGPQEALAPTGRACVHAARCGNPGQFGSAKRKIGFIIPHRAKCRVDPLYPPSTRGDVDDLAKHMAIGEARGQARLRLGVTVESDEKASVPTETDWLIIKAQFRYRGRRCADEDAALLCFAIKDDAGNGVGSWIFRRPHTAYHQQERGRPTPHRRPRAFSSACAEASALA